MGLSSRGYDLLQRIVRLFHRRRTVELDIGVDLELAEPAGHVGNKATLLNVILPGIQNTESTVSGLSLDVLIEAPDDQVRRRAVLGSL